MTEVEPMNIETAVSKALDGLDEFCIIFDDLDHLGNMCEEIGESYASKELSMVITRYEGLLNEVYDLLIVQEKDLASDV